METVSREPSAGFDKEPSAGSINELLQWGVAALALEKSGVSGDLSLVAPFAGGALVAVIDGLGHGAEAAVPARNAVDILRRNAGESPLKLIQRCHEKLRLTRGAVMSIASLNARKNTLTWVGIGNVEGRLIRNDPNALPGCEFLFLNSGTVGDRIPRLQVRELPVFVGDTLVFATDGIRASGLNCLTNPGKGPKDLAKNILNQHKRGNDDALVLVARSLIGKK